MTLARFRFLILFGPWLLLRAQPPYTLITTSGGPMFVTPASATSVTLPMPAAVASDLSGNLYFSTTSFGVSGQASIFKVDPSGTVYRIAGTGTSGYSGDGNSALTAQFAADNPNPLLLAVDYNGNIFVADHYRIRKITLQGIVTTIAGTGVLGSTGDGGPALNAQISPNSLAVDAAGNLYFGEYSFFVRKIDTHGIITTVAGKGINPPVTSPGIDGIPATEANLISTYVAVDGPGNLYITDDTRIRKVGLDGIITTVAGNGGQGFSPDGSIARNVSLNAPGSVAVDSAGNVYFSERFRIRKVSPDGVLSTVAGNGTVGFSGDGGPAMAAQISVASPIVAPDHFGNLFITDYYNRRIRRVTPDGIINTVAGTDAAPISNGAFSQINPSGIARDPSGNLYFCDTYRVLRSAPDGTLSVVAGTGTAGYSGDNAPAIGARLLGVSALAADVSGNLYLADGHYVRQVDTQGGIHTLADVQTKILAIAVDTGGNVYVSVFAGTIPAYNGAQLLRITPSRAIVPVTSIPTAANPYYRLNADFAGNLYVLDTVRVYRMSPAGVVTLIAGDGQPGNSGDGGSALNASFNAADGAVAVDSAGHLFIADPNAHAIRRVDAQGVITTAAVAAASTTEFPLNPTALVADAAGNVFVVDSANFSIRELVRTDSAPLLGFRINRAGPFPSAGYVVYADNIGSAYTHGTLNGSLSLAGEPAPQLLGLFWVCQINVCTLDGFSTAPTGQFPPLGLGPSNDWKFQHTLLATYSGAGSPAVFARLTTNFTPPVLSVLQSHTGNFWQGQTGATYTIAVHGSGPQNVSGPVTVTVALPAGMTQVSIDGQGWSCVANACSTNQSWSGSIDYPSLTLTVNIAQGAASSLVPSVVVSGAGSSGAYAQDPTVVTDPPHPPFFSGEQLLSNSVYYLSPFGYYTYLPSQWIYHFDLGYEYFVDARDSQNGLYLYDFSSGHWLYTSPTYPFPYLYDFTLKSVLYYYPDPNRPGSYTSNPRQFFNLGTGRIITQ